MPPRRSRSLEPPNAEQIALFNNGDEKASEYIYRFFVKYLHYFAVKLVKSQHVADDIVSDTILKLLDKPKDFTNLHEIRGFLLMTVRNACISHMRKEEVAGTYVDETLFLNKDNNHEELADVEAIKAKVYEAVYRHVEALPDGCREIFKLVFYERLTTQQIAARLNLNIRYVRKQKVRALKLIRIELMKKGLLTYITWYCLYLLYQYLLK